MKILGIKPGPTIGRILEALLQEVIDDPAKNTREYLESRIKELGDLSDDELTRIAQAAETRVEMREDEREGQMKAKYFVK